MKVVEKSHKDQDRKGWGMIGLKKLRPEEDAFGQEIWACYKGERTSEIVERDDGYFDASEYGPKMYFQEYED